MISCIPTILKRHCKITWCKHNKKNERGDLQTSAPEFAGRIHSRWLSMMYPRLFIARQLLQDDGVIFVSIDDNEVHHLRLLMNEVFGEQNFLAQIIVRANSRGQTYNQLSKTHEHILVFARDAGAELFELEKNAEQNDLTLSDAISAYNVRELRNRNPKFGKHNRANLFFAFYVNPANADEDGFFEVSLEPSDKFSNKVEPYNSEGKESCWRWSKKLVLKHIGEDTQHSTVVAKKKTDGSFGIYEKYRKTTFKPKTIWDDNEVLTENGTAQLKALGLSEHFPFPKPVELIKRCIKLGSADEDIVLDFFSGSGTTAQAILELNREDEFSNRHFILVQLPEPTHDTTLPTIAEIGKERIRRVAASIKKSIDAALPLNGLDVPEDLGFKVWKLGESHFRQFQPTPVGDTQAYLTQLELMNDPLLPYWEPSGVLYEVALKEGFGLNTCLEIVPNVVAAKVWCVSDKEKGQRFFACLDEDLTLDALRPLNLAADDTFICRGIALDDTAAANLALQCRLKMI